MTDPNSHSPRLTYSARKAFLCLNVHISVPEKSMHCCYETKYQDWLVRVKCVKLGQGMETDISFRIKWGKDGSQRKGQKSRKKKTHILLQKSLNIFGQMSNRMKHNETRGKQDKNKNRTLGGWVGGKRRELLE